MAGIDDDKRKIISIIEPVIKDSFMELAEIDIGGFKNRYIRIKIDKPGSSVRVEDCVRMSRLFNEKLEAEESIGNYTLEVSSPGIDRALSTPEHFERFRGKTAKIITFEKIGGSNAVEGIIKDFDGNTLTIETDKTETEIEYENIKKANLKAEF
ncbi:MAG: ribosome maturation factor RimP [bacterium]